MEETGSLNNAVNAEPLPQNRLQLEREARKRKILENAKNRLEMLNGRGKGNLQETEGPTIDPYCKFPDPEVEPDMPQYIPPSPYNFEHSNGLFSSLNNDTQLAPQKPFLLKSRLHVLLAAVIVYIFSMVGNEDIGNYSIFIPAGVLIALELTYFREERKMHPFTNLLVTLCGIESGKANRLFQFFNTIKILIVDIGILVFFFCTFTFLLSCADERFLNLISVK